MTREHTANVVRLFKLSADEAITLRRVAFGESEVRSLRRADIDRLLDASDVGICLDTGHAYLGGADPVEVAKVAGGRVLHVHLKDVDEAKAERVRSGEVAFREAVLDGLFVPLGEGGVDIAGVIQTLEEQGYRGWYVLEQDVSLKSDPPEGEGPKADAVDSVAFLADLVATGA